MSGGEERPPLQPDSLAGTNPWLTASAWAQAGCRWPSSCLGKLAGALSWCGTPPAARAQHPLPTALPQHPGSLIAPSAPARHQRCDSTVTPVRQQGHREPWCRGGQENYSHAVTSRRSAARPCCDESSPSPCLLQSATNESLSVQG